MFTYSVERAREIKKFHVAVVHRRLKNVQIQKACARAKLLVTWRHTSPLYFTYTMWNQATLILTTRYHKTHRDLFYRNSLESYEILQWQQYCSHHAYAFNIEYFMESAGVRYLHTSCFCIRNLTRSLRSLVWFLIQKQRVGKYRTKHFTCGIVFIVYILRQSSFWWPFYFKSFQNA